MIWDTYKFHPSALGSIMTDSRTKDPLGETCKGYLMELYIARKYNRYKNITNQYMEKGTQVEEESITLYSLVKKQFYKKNQETFENDYFIGTPDIITKDKVIDIKSCWDIHTLFSTLVKPLNKDYKYQLHGYMDLCKKDNSKLAYCLVNTPEKFILDAKKKLSWQMGVIDSDADPLYMEACEKLQHEMTFDDIPKEERYIEFEIPFDPEVLEKIYTRIEDCRAFLNKLA